MTDTGIVNIWAKAPASAPRDSSWAVESDGRARRVKADVRRKVWKKKYANSDHQIYDQRDPR